MKTNITKREKNDEWFKKEYPDCDTYEKYEATFLKKGGFASFDAYVEEAKQNFKDECKAYFGAKITYAYEFEGDKMTLIQKFTGLKNMVHSECRFYGELSVSDIRISFGWVSIKENDAWYGGTPNTDNKTISFESEDGEKVIATYTEDIDAETVTIEFKGKEYVCKFEGEVYTQE